MGDFTYNAASIAPSGTVYLGHPPLLHPRICSLPTCKPLEGAFFDGASNLISSHRGTRHSFHTQLPVYQQYGASSFAWWHLWCQLSGWLPSACSWTCVLVHFVRLGEPFYIAISAGLQDFFLALRACLACSNRPCSAAPGGGCDRMSKGDTLTEMSKFDTLAEADAISAQRTVEV